jgi:hypothetical protein
MASSAVRLAVEVDAGRAPALSTDLRQTIEELGLSASPRLEGS